VLLDKPTSETLAFSGEVLFPTEALARLIAEAEAGKDFASFDVFDGSPDGQTVFSTSTVIAGGASPSADLGDEAPVNAAGLAGLRHWTITMSYYEKKGRTDGAPFFEMRAILYENGVRRSLHLSYDSGFTLTGQLKSLELLDPPSC
jgi:hypothetical protein